MSATWSWVNTSLASDYPNRQGDNTTPTTPRPKTAPSLPSPSMDRTEDSITPTGANLGAMSDQGSLPKVAFRAISEERKSVGRDDSSTSNESRMVNDMNMDNSDDGSTAEGSDTESIDVEGNRGKKRRTQRFYCTDYPPCHLSFTRSEHLARHIRKHTGERPFQCHCSRRFSRLDNLRQHAQTVHVNEDIPGDSLAATGTRFQRQIRTDRARPVSNRSRASTAGSQTSNRGHQRNALSASSIFCQSNDRTRPAPLIMARDSRIVYRQDMYPPESPTTQFQHFRPHSPGGSSSPISTKKISNQNSPRWTPSTNSPVSSHVRGHSQSISRTGRTPGRRLSVPSSEELFQSPQDVHYAGANTGFISPSTGFASPAILAAGPVWSRRDSMLEDPDWRRRTWHPDSSGFTSRLNQVKFAQNYYAKGPLPAPTSIVPSNAPIQSLRLPGIESFDPLRRPVTPPRRGPSPMVIDTPSGSFLSNAYRDERPTSSWESGVRGMHRLDIARGTPPSDTAGSWACDTQPAVQVQAENTRMTPPSVRFEQSPFSRASAPRGFHQHTASAPILARDKRQGWHYAPTLAAESMGIRASPDSNSSEGGIPGTPGSASYTEVTPAILHSNGYVEARSPIQTRTSLSKSQNRFNSYQAPNTNTSNHSRPYTQQPLSSHHEHLTKQTDSEMSKLDALVAVATSGDNVATAY